MANPQSTFPPRCPECFVESIKFVMFQNDWYWQCPKCKMDVDNPPKGKDYKTLKEEAKKNDIYSYKVSYSNPSYLQEIDLHTGTISCSSFGMSSNFHTAGISNGEMQIQFEVVFKPSGMKHTIKELEVFPMTYGFQPTEEDMWKALMNHLMPGQLVFNIDDAKEMYASHYLKKTYPGVTVSFV